MLCYIFSDLLILCYLIQNQLAHFLPTQSVVSILYLISPCFIPSPQSMVLSLQSMFYTDRNFLFFQLTFLDMIMYIIFKESELPVHAIRWTRVFRPLFLVNISESRQVKIVIVCSRRSDTRWQYKVNKESEDKQRGTGKLKFLLFNFKNNLTVHDCLLIFLISFRLEEPLETLGNYFQRLHMFLFCYFL